jgi:hypothetical protein
MGELRMQLKFGDSAHLAQSQSTDDMTELSPTKSQGRNTSTTELSTKFNVTKTYKMFANKNTEILNKKSTMDFYYYYCYTAFVGAFAKLRKSTNSLSCPSDCPSACPHGTTRLPPDDFP